MRHRLAMQIAQALDLGRSLRGRVVLEVRGHHPQRTERGVDRRLDGHARHAEQRGIARPWQQVAHHASHRQSRAHHVAEAAPRKDSSAFIDQELRARVDGDITAFLAAFDAALGHDTQENRAALREATDRLLRAGARTRIELERLEARIPLPPRNDGRPGDTAWRPR